MSTELYTLLPLTSTESSDLSVFAYTNKQKGAGFHARADSLHTAVFTLDSFKGSIKLQGTLMLYPGESDWVDVTLVDAVDSTLITSTLTRNFTGNWIWIRAAYILEQGSLEIRYNF